MRTSTFLIRLQSKSPRVCNLHPPNVFVSEHTCLLRRIQQHGRGYPDRCIFAKKELVETSSEGWKCVYDGAFRPFIIPAPVVPCNVRDKQCTRPKAAKPRKLEESTNPVYSSSSSEFTLADVELTDEATHTDEEDDLRPDDLSFWFADESQPLNPKTSNDIIATERVSIIDRPRILNAQHDLIYNRLRNEINQVRYALLVNTLDAIVTVRWKPNERTHEAWAKFTDARRRISGTHKKKLVASCSSSLTVYSLNGIRKRILRWCAWHSV